MKLRRKNIFLEDLIKHNDIKKQIGGLNENDESLTLLIKKIVSTLANENIDQMQSDNSVTSKISSYIPSMSNIIPSMSNIIPSMSNIIPSISNIIPNMPNIIPNMPSIFNNENNNRKTNIPYETLEKKINEFTNKWKNKDNNQKIIFKI
uniref:Uncharacterized protein n=1 Tax=viral metagenome TaxID=1070528 RepID=A0A6C0I0F1_9ZZZZ